MHTSSNHGAGSEPRTITHTCVEQFPVNGMGMKWSMHGRRNLK